MLNNMKAVSECFSWKNIHIEYLKFWVISSENKNNCYLSCWMMLKRLEKEIYLNVNVLMCADPDVVRYSTVVWSIGWNSCIIRIPRIVPKPALSVIFFLNVCLTWFSNCSASLFQNVVLRFFYLVCFKIEHINTRAAFARSFGFELLLFREFVKVSRPGQVKRTRFTDCFR